MRTEGSHNDRGPAISAGLKASRRQQAVARYGELVVRRTEMLDLVPQYKYVRDMWAIDCRRQGVR